MNRQLSPERAAAMAAAEALPGAAVNTCVLCGAATDLCGIFSPADSQVYGAPPGKVRAIRYGLCPTCAAEPGVFERVELELLRSLRGDA